MLGLTLFLFALLVAYFYLKSKYTFWEKLGVHYDRPNILFGNFFRAVTFQEGIGEAYCNIYKKYKDDAYVGFYKMQSPSVVLRDADLIKDILIKDFDSFAKNDIDVDVDVDPVFGRNPFVLTGDKWKTGRNQIMPALSSGKIKNMVPLMLNVSKAMIKYIKEHGTMEAKDLCCNFTTDSVATCAFGLEANSFVDPEAEFRRMGKKIFDIDTITLLKMLVAFLLPSLGNLMRIKFIPDEAANYFRNIIRNTMVYRSQNKIIRNDFLDMMQQTKEKLGDSFGELEITAHAVSFFVDGFETSAATMSFALYCLASHPEVQRRLRRDINDTVEKNGGQITYDAIQSINYLDMVILENMRRYPPVVFVGKVCTKPYMFPPAHKGAKEVHISPGTCIHIPLLALHNDDRYFPNPERYDPERFSDENKQSIPKGSFLPFGEGPRICLGQRFGMMQVKVAIVTILKEYEVTVNEKTIEPLEIDGMSFIAKAKGGIWLDFKKI